MCEGSHGDVSLLCVRMEVLYWLPWQPCRLLIGRELVPGHRSRRCLCILLVQTVSPADTCVCVLGGAGIKLWGVKKKEWKQLLFTPLHLSFSWALHIFSLFSAFLTFPTLPFIVLLPLVNPILDSILFSSCSHLLRRKVQVVGWRPRRQGSRPVFFQRGGSSRSLPWPSLCHGEHHF